MNEEIPQQNSCDSAGYLEIFIGPMYSGKTSKLLDMYKKYTFCKIPVCVINHEIDVRYHETMLSTHDKLMIPCLQTSRLMDIWSITDLDATIENQDEINNHMLMRAAKVILINEAQFFDDLLVAVTSMVNDGKIVYISGLDGDFERKKFGQILDLVPFCDKITKLTSLCGLCKNGTPGIFSRRLTQDTEQTLIGSDNYIPVCRKCYNC
jgi:thymidine kinase